MGGLGAAALGRLADATSIGYVYQVCAYLPLLGVVAILLPKMGASAPERRCRERAGPCGRARSRFQATLRSCARAGSMPMISPPSP